MRSSGFSRAAADRIKQSINLYALSKIAQWSHQNIDYVSIRQSVGREKTQIRHWLVDLAVGPSLDRSATLFPLSLASVLSPLATTKAVQAAARGSAHSPRRTRRPQSAPPSARAGRREPRPRRRRRVPRRDAGARLRESKCRHWWSRGRDAKRKRMVEQIENMTKCQYMEGEERKKGGRE